MGTIESVKSTHTLANGVGATRYATLTPQRAREQLRTHLIAHLTAHLEPGECHTLEALDAEGNTIESFTKLADGPYGHRQA